MNSTELLLSTLATKIRCISLNQIESQVLRASSPNAIRNQLRNLKDQGLIQIEEHIAHPVPKLTSPILNWKPGSDNPRFGSIAHKLRTRWKESPKPIQVITATKKSSSIYGGFGDGYCLRADEVTHDLCVAELYLHLLKNDPDSANHWVPEAQLKFEKAFDLVPDAVIRTDSNSPPMLILDWAGSYRSDKLVRMHNAYRDFPYQLW